MLIRQATSSDKDFILEFDLMAQADPSRMRFVESAVKSADCLVAEVMGKVVGYAVLEYTFFGNGFVSMVYVADKSRRQGIARGLMQALASRCETPKLFTSTNQSNQPMQQLLAALGYTLSGVIHNLDEGDPELVYFLNLTKSVS